MNHAYVLIRWLETECLLVLHRRWKYQKDWLKATKWLPASNAKESQNLIYIESQATLHALWLNTLNWFQRFVIPFAVNVEAKNPPPSEHIFLVPFGLRYSHSRPKTLRSVMRKRGEFWGRECRRARKKQQIFNTTHAYIFNHHINLI